MEEEHPDGVGGEEAPEEEPVRIDEGEAVEDGILQPETEIARQSTLVERPGSGGDESPFFGAAAGRKQVRAGEAFRRR